MENQKQIQFGTFWDPDHKTDSLRMTDGKVLPMSIISGYNYKDTTKESWPCITVYEVPVRPRTDTVDWNTWNGCTFVDIDLKHIKDSVTVSPQQIMEDVVLCLGGDYNLYLYQLSASGIGLHFIFSWQVDKSIESFKKVAKIGQERIKTALRKTHPRLYLAIEAHDQTAPKSRKVVDDCTDKYTQPLRMSPFPLKKGVFASHHHFGYIDQSELDSVPLPQQPTDNGLKKDSRWNDTAASWDGDYGRIGWGNEACMQLACVLQRATTYETALSIFTAMFSGSYRGGRKSSWSVIRREFEQNWKRTDLDISRVPRSMLSFVNDHLSIFTLEEEGCAPTEEDPQMTDQQRLDAFISAHLDDRRKVAPFTPDHTIELSPTDYLGFHEYEIHELMAQRNTTQLYIESPCGSGKTKYIISEFAASRKAIIVAHLNSIKDSNYAEQMTEAGIRFEKPSNTELLQAVKSNLRGHDHLLLGWPQFALLLTSSADISQYHILIDEVHAFQSQIGFRYKDICKIISNIDRCTTLTCVTATALREHAVLLTDENALRLSVTKERPYDIEYYSVQNENTDMTGKVTDTIAAFTRHILECEGEGGNQKDVRVAILDDHCHNDYAAIFETYGWQQDTDFLHLYRDAREEGAVREVMLTQRLPQQVLISTSYGKEGVEYKDEVSTLYVCIPTYWTVTANDVEQFLNRYRHKRHVRVYLFAVGLSDESDFELARKAPCLVSESALSDPELRSLVTDIEGRSLNEATIIPLHRLMTEKYWLGGVADLVAAYYENISENNIKSPLNQQRLLKPLYTTKVGYRNEVKAKRAWAEDVKDAASDRETVERMLGCRGTHDGLMTALKGSGFDLERTGDAEYLFGGEIATEGNYGAKKGGSVKVAEEHVNDLIEAVGIIREVMTLLNDDADDRSEAVTDNKWAFCEIWRNGEGTVNWQRAAKFARLYRVQREVGVSRRQRWTNEKDVEWGKKVMDKMMYMAGEKEVGFAEVEKEGHIDWTKVRMVSKSVREREKGGRVREKYSTLDGSVKFKTREEMYDYAVEKMGYKSNIESFMKNWQRLNLFKRL